jgi:hypothetical protein
MKTYRILRCRLPELYNNSFAPGEWQKEKKSRSKLNASFSFSFLLVVDRICIASYLK